ncbi:hypothetical protein [Acinetobacter pittii]|uniref:hypothetical protein n=1 Tax=Acinetobacter pittii TaxID=48296 RepID=UPI00397E2B65
MANAKLVEVEGSLVEHDSSKYGGGGLYIYGKIVSLINDETSVQLKVVSAPSSLYRLADKKNKEEVILFGRLLDQSLYPTRIMNLKHEEYSSPSSKEFNDQFIQLQQKTPKEARQWGCLSIFWLSLIIFSMVFKMEIECRENKV